MLKLDVPEKLKKIWSKSTNTEEEQVEKIV